MRSRPARIYKDTPRNLAFLAGRLRAGELVAVPTETVYGLAANALDETACLRVFNAKRRPTSDPLIVHLHSVRQLPLICHPNETARRLAAHFWPGPLTLVLPKSGAVPGLVTAGKATVAARVPAHPGFRRLLRRAGLPLAAPSANPFGYVSPTTAEHVKSGLGNRIKYILDGGPCPIGLESTIVDLTNEKSPRLLRLGAITREQLEATLGRAVAPPRRPRAARTDEAQDAPGMLPRHYSPRKPVVLHRSIPRSRPLDEAFVHFRRPKGVIERNEFWLDERGDLRGVARNLFAVLRRLDRSGFRRMHVQLAPRGGLGDAINDRLRRAASR